MTTWVLSLKLLKIFLKLFQTTEKVLKLPRSASDSKIPFKIPESCLRLLRTAWDPEKYFKKFSTLPGTVLEFQEMFDISGNCLVVLRTVWKSVFEKYLTLPRIVREVRELFEVFENTARKHFWQRRRSEREQWPFRVIV